MADIEALKPRMKATWMAGDFAEIAKSIEPHAHGFMTRRAIVPGTEVLDVACGSGNTAILAALRGAKVTGVDIAPNLLERARNRADQQGLEMTLDEGDVEDLPYPDASFDQVISMYGAMFAPRPELAASEMLRVCRPAGQIVMANWPPDSFVGQMAKVSGSYAPPPEGVPSPLLWADEATVQDRFGDAVTDLRLDRVKVSFEYPFPAGEVVDFYRRYYGPVQRAFESLPVERQTELRRDLVNHWEAHNRATDGTVYLETEYVEVAATRA